MHPLLQSPSHVTPSMSSMCKCINGLQHTHMCICINVRSRRAAGISECRRLVGV